MAARKISNSSSTVPPTIFYGTPKSTNPTALLRNNLKEQVKQKMEDKVAALPPSSPYTLMEGENENGSPSYEFTRLTNKPRSAQAAVKYLTATPGVAIRKAKIAGTPGRAPNKARRVLGCLDENVDLTKKEEVTPKKMDSSIDMEENDLKEDIPISPAKNPQLVTGDLAMVCIIM